MLVEGCSSGVIGLDLLLTRIQKSLGEATRGLVETSRAGVCVNLTLSLSTLQARLQERNTASALASADTWRISGQSELDPDRPFDSGEVGGDKLADLAAQTPLAGGR